ncbi:MAG: sialate O-acetylesterase [Ruminococcus sp.]|nr:sialate O-acetylesterase [Ruminococcus sp.]MBR4622853.1 sialate O-acetylesterase [Ruminococcus sp.]
MFKAAAVFSDNMVLQRGKNVKLWGECDCDGTVRASISGSSAECSVKDGKWCVTLPPMQAGGPYELVLELDGSEQRRFYNVMIGEVWLCGGQSNMELELQNAKDGKEELKTLTADIPVRFYYTNKVGSVEEAIEAEKNSGWGVCDPEGSRAWSAVGYHFARKLSKELGVTVGLIGCNWGGTSATSWIDKEHILADSEIADYMDEYYNEVKGKSLEQQKKDYEDYLAYDKDWNEKAQEVYKVEPTIGWLELQDKIGKNIWPGPKNEFNPFVPGKMYESMLMRVCPYTLAGFLYYQGESDDHKPRVYYSLFTKLIRIWREKWEDDRLPFIMVQLPAFKFEADPDYKHWCLIREAQMRAFETVKNTGIAVCIDCGEFNNIHPLDKKPVGERLCLQAEKLVYGMDVSAFGPLYKSYVTDGSKLIVSLDYADGLHAEGAVTGFEVAGEDKKFFPARAEIEGSRIVLTSSEVSSPRFARYCWGNFPEYSLFGGNGLPLAPFRTSMQDE